MKPHLDLLERMYDALRTPLGIVLETEDPDRLRQRLYALRREREASDPQLRTLAFVLSPTNPNHLLVLRRSASNEED